MTLYVPQIDSDTGTLAAAFAYAEAGWFLGPIDQHHTDPAQRKNPGAVLGSGWHHKTSRDPHVVASWFAGTDHGIFLHAGRSGAIVFDVDNPDNIPEPLGLALGSIPPPMQTTRTDDTRRGHYLYAQPATRDIGNGTGRLGNTWGDVRGRNGVIVVAPTAHAKANACGLYAWQQTGPVPELPPHLAALLDDGGPSIDRVATDAETAAFLSAHTRSERPQLFQAVINSAEKSIAAGGSRHDTLVSATCWAMREAASGCYPAEQARARLLHAFTEAIGTDRNAAMEFDGILRWAIAQAGTIDPEVVRTAIDQRAPARSDVLTLDSAPPTSTAPGAAPAMTATLPDVDTQHRGQARMAYRLEAAYADQLMHVYGLGWFTWDRARWIPAHRGQDRQAVLEVLRDALATSLGDKELQADIAKCQSDAGQRGVLGIAAALPGFAHEVADIDADPYLLNMANGTLDLRTMELHDHDPTDRITKVTRGAWRPTEQATAWTTFLEQVLPDPEVRVFLQRLAGVGLLGIVVEHILGILTGTGRNGKGVFYGTLGHALGDYAIVAEPDLFMHREGAHPTGQMDLRGVRWAVVSESDKGRRLAEATMKKLTGGDPIKARHMRADFVTFNPSHTPLLVTNHLPKVSGDDPALWARMRVVPFDVVIPRSQQDPHLPERLQLDPDAVLSWAVAGYQDYIERGSLDEPAAVKIATDAYQQDNDAIARFLADADRVYINPNAHTETGAAFDAWRSWAVEDGADTVSLKAFGQALDRLGYPATKSNGRRIRRGIGLYSSENEGQDQ